jgi:hypothetical protein
MQSTITFLSRLWHIFSEVTTVSVLIMICLELWPDDIVRLGVIWVGVGLAMLTYKMANR